MEINIPKGKYILAVSGGVDSMALLDLLCQKQGMKLVVAHFNHGIRTDSGKDEELVRRTAEEQGLVFEAGRTNLGKSASEAVARKARYEFLEKAMIKHGARAIVTAHHRDDLIETALINTLRGTKRRGLTSIVSNQKVLRPLLPFSKAELTAYAKAHKLCWREDLTNEDERYLRNFLRRRLQKVPVDKLDDFAVELDRAERINDLIDKDIAIISQILIKDNKVERQLFISLPADIARELTHFWLGHNGLAGADKKMIDRVMTFIKTGKPGDMLSLGKNVGLQNSVRTSELWKE